MDDAQWKRLSTLNIDAIFKYPGVLFNTEFLFNNGTEICFITKRDFEQSVVLKTTFNGNMPFLQEKYFN